jgi:hypothetical protein
MSVRFICVCRRYNTQNPAWSADRVFATAMHRRALSLHLGFNRLLGADGGQTGTSSNLHNTDYAGGAFRAFFAATAFTPQHNSVPGSSVPNESWATPRTPASVAPRPLLLPPCGAK